jgi:glycosyltransferase involved in cell wall biosynthesis
MKKALYVASVFSHLACFHIPFMKALKERGFVVYAMARTDRPGVVPKLEQHDIKCIEMPFSRSPYSWKNLKVYKMLRRMFKENRYDIIHVHTPAAAFLTRAAARNTKQGLIVYTAHGFHFYKGAPKRNWLIYFPVEKLARRWTDILVTINHEDYENAQKLGYEPGKSLVYTHGVGINIDEFVVPDRNGNGTVFVCVGEMNKNKNQEWLLDVWKEFDDPETELRIIGDGPLEQKLRKKASPLKNVKFLGYRTDIAQQLAESDVLISVSHREGLPRNVMEAMAAGKPVIGTNIRGTKDLVKATGLLVKPGDKAALRRAVSVMKDKQSRKLFSSYTRREIKPFSEENTVNEIMKVYSRLEGSE